MSEVCDCLNSCGDDPKVDRGQLPGCERWKAHKARKVRLSRALEVVKDSSGSHVCIRIATDTITEEDLDDIRSALKEGGFTNVITFKDIPLCR